MTSNLWTTFSNKVSFSMMLALLAATALFSQTAPPTGKAALSKSAQQGFLTPDEAVKTLIQAAADFDLVALSQILGDDGKDLISTGDPVGDKNNSAAFATMAREKYSLAADPANPGREILSIGTQNWPLPIPLVKKADKWYFDSKAGRQEILFRRIGANELDAIQVCRGFVEAQQEYASTIHDNSGIHQYAQRLISTPGKQDGLFWTNADGTPGGPVSERVAKAIEQGYSLESGSAYHGYYFRLLKGQGPAAHLGTLDYMVGGVMIGGFAMIAVPAEYRVTGVQTFIVNNDGVVYQKDLGPNSLAMASKIDRFNPDKTWRRTDDEWEEQ